MSEYYIKVVSTVYLHIEAETEEKAIEQACQNAWKYDADEMDATVISKEEME